MEGVWLFFLIFFSFFIGCIGFFYLQSSQSNSKETLSTPSEKTLQDEKKVKKKGPKIDKTAQFQRKRTNSSSIHPLFWTTLKGHTERITSIAYHPNNLFMATSSTDRSIRLFYKEKDTKDQKKQMFKYHRINLAYDYATAIQFNPNGRILACATEGQKIVLYNKLHPKPELLREFSIQHQTIVHSLLFNDIGEYMTILSCPSETDTTLKCWSKDGEYLDHLNTNQMENYHAVNSVDNRFIAIASYTPEVKIYEIKREKTGQYQKIQKAMTLQGNQTGTTDVAFDGSDQIPVNHIATASKDGVVRLWDINVRYALQEDPRILKEINIIEKEMLPTSSLFQRLDLSPNGKILVLSYERILLFLKTSTMEIIERIEEAHEDEICRILISPNSQQVMIQAQNSKHVKVYEIPTSI